MLDHHSSIRPVQEDDSNPVEKETSPSSSLQACQPPIPESGRRKSAMINTSSAASTTKFTKPANAVPVKFHPADCYRPKV
ncbi:hypothetical protein PCANC_15471 [Puccinia coronata f. sp. avenae]|uniref:Uncharacterized protein n=1 Tax=Puccinia coronata f. sp. avenae TaxID=200324 RepID=A0A2N5VC32_9BASI|nr:hypothetical protein PCASD_08201 [Puccinia coronata f. sp. avenae]PLW48687.1 hypothetical protein PCANC_15471 [Puccinia coronata f. sp. avenae]